MTEFLLPYNNRNDIIHVERWLQVNIGLPIREVERKTNIKTYAWTTQRQFINNWTTPVINVQIWEDVDAVAFKLCFYDVILKTNGNR